MLGMFQKMKLNDEKTSFEKAKAKFPFFTWHQTRTKSN